MQHDKFSISSYRMPTCIAAAFIFGSCISPPPPTETKSDPVLSDVLINLPTPGYIHVGESFQVSATLNDQNGSPYRGYSTVTWSSSNPSVATVSTSGIVTGLATGTAGVRADARDSYRSTYSIRYLDVLAAVAVANVRVSVQNANLSIGQTSQASFVAEDRLNNVLAGRTVSWQSDRPGVATVSSTGLVTAVGAGIANIVAVVEGVQGAAIVTVAPGNASVASVLVSLGNSALTVGQSTPASFQAKDAANNVLSGRSATWSTSNSAVATVTGAGIVTAVGAGSATISATVEGRIGSTSLSVISAGSSLVEVVDDRGTYYLRPSSVGLNSTNPPSTGMTVKLLDCTNLYVSFLAMEAMTYDGSLKLSNCTGNTPMRIATFRLKNGQTFEAMNLNATPGLSQAAAPYFVGIVDATGAQYARQFEFIRSIRVP
jgi:uncharacterized protein YjdB